MKKMYSLFFACLSMVLLMGSTARADVMYRPTVWWNYGTNGPGLTDQSGYVSGVTDVDAFLATNPDSGSGYWNGQGTFGDDFLGFDLGATVELTGMLVWQANNYYGIAL